MKKYDWSAARVYEAVRKSANYSDTLRYLGVPIRGNNIATLKRVIEKHGLDTSHFVRFVPAKGPISNTYIPSVEYTNKPGRRITSGKLRRKLIEEGIKDYKCDCCGISKWNGREITLQLHHIDGDNENNSLDNLQLLCPNCHSQTVNYRGNKTERKRYYCPDCGAEIGKGSQRCVKCSAKIKRILPISDEELRAEYAVLKSYRALSKKYGISDVAIRKHIEGK